MAIAAVIFGSPLPAGAVGTPPSAPLIGTATAGVKSATITWTVGANGGSPIADFVITAHFGATSKITRTVLVGPVGSALDPTEGASDRYVFKGLSNAVTYNFAVASKSAAGVGLVSALSNAVTTPSLPASPVIGTATPGSSAATVTWTVGADGGAPITTFSVICMLTPTITKVINVAAGAVGSQTDPTPGATDSATVTRLTAGRVYTCEVAARSAVGIGPRSGASNAVTPMALPVAAVVTSVSPGNGTAALSWLAQASYGSPISAFVVTPYVGATAQSALVLTPQGTGSPLDPSQGAPDNYSISGLTNGVTYTFTVGETNAVGTKTSAHSPAVTVGAPAAPTGVGATYGSYEGAYYESAVVTWTVPADNGSPISSFTITPSAGTAIIVNAGAIGSALDPTPGAVDQATVTASIGSGYTFTVRAKNARGNGPVSASSNAISMPTPNQPSGVTATGVSAGVTVSWVVPADNGVPIDGFTVTASVGGLQTSSISPSAGAVGSSLDPTPGATDNYTVTGLTYGTTYTFTVTALGLGGTGEPSSSSNPVTDGAPNPPGLLYGLSAAPGDGSATLSWTVPSNNGAAITSFVVTPSVGGMAGTPIVLATGAVGSALDPTAGAIDHYTATGLSNGTSYSFTVAATNAVGQGAASTAVTVTPSTAPGAPTNVVASAGASNSQNMATVTVTWSPPASDGGSPLTSYVVTASPGGGIASVPYTATQATFTFSATGTTYTFTVAADNTNGAGASSAPSNAVTVIGMPGPPVHVGAASGDTAATVSWTVPANNGAAISSFVLTPSVGGVQGTPISLAAGAVGSALDPTPGAADSYTVPGLTNGTSYTFTVAATNAVGQGFAVSAPSAVTPFTVPIDVAASAGSGGATVSWTVPSANVPTITAFVITPYRGSQPGTTVTVGAGNTVSFAPGANDSYTLGGLTNGNTYTFTVAARNTQAFGAPSSASNAVTPSTVPAQITNAAATPGNTSVTLTWTVPAANGSAITGFVVTPASGPSPITLTAGTVGSALDPTPGAVDTYTLTGLTTGTEYAFTISAVNADGAGLASSYFPPDGVMPGSPTTPTLVSASAGPGSITLVWTVGPDNGTAPLTEFDYDIHSGGSGYGIGFPVGSVGSPLDPTPGATDTYTITGLTPGVSYSVSISDYNGYWSQFSSTIANVVPTTGVPGAPTNVTAVAWAGSATVTWTVPANGGPAINDFIVTAYVGGSPVGSYMTGIGGIDSPLDPTPGASDSFTVTGLSSGTNYTFTVEAANAGVTGPASAMSNPVVPT